MATSNSVYKHLLSHLSFVDWLESNNYDLFANAEPGTIAFRNVYPGNMIPQGVPSGLSEYGAVILLKPYGNPVTSLMIYVDIFCQIAKYDFSSNSWVKN